MSLPTRPIGMFESSRHANEPKTAETHMRPLLAWALSLLLTAPAVAGVELASDINANVAVVTAFDTNSGLYTYRYTITNFGDSSRNLHEFHIPLRGAAIVNVQAPAGWESYLKFDQT